jgi:hypothetical protein
MNGQSQVYRYPYLAAEGMLVNTSAVNPIEVFPGARALGTVYAGRWVWAATAPAGADKDGVVEQFVQNSAASGAPVGLTYRNLSAALPADKEYENAYNDGQPVPVAKSDAIWVKTATVATVGQKAFAVLADGTTKTGAAGATVGGAVETGWQVVALQSDGAIGDLIAISKI